MQPFRGTRATDNTFLQKLPHESSLAITYFIEIWFHLLADIRQRLTDQLRSLDNRYDAQREQLQDFQEYFKQRAEVEMEYAKNLERLHERLTRRQKAVQ